MRVPRGEDMATEYFLPAGRYLRLASQGASSSGSYTVCGDRVCIAGERGANRCRALVQTRDGGLLLAGELLQPYRAPADRPRELTWVRQPDEVQIVAHTPPGATGPGSATLRCLLRTDGTLRDCAVINEAPAGQGFGASALRLARYYRASPRYVGRAGANSPATFTVAFPERPIEGDPVAPGVLPHS